ncbi:MAG: phage major capsid protein [Myxococcota bacterium]
MEIQERRAEPASRRLVFPATSETPVPMRTWELGEYLEVLDHSPAAIRLDRLRSAAPLLKDHDRTAQIGVVDSVEIQDRRLVVAVRMGTSELAESEARDIAAGIRRNVSIGYLVHKLELVEKRDSGPPVYRATDWEPVEVSTVAIPADVSVGFGRSDAAQPIRTRVVREEVRSMIPEPTPAPGPSEIELRAATAAERERVEQIFAIGERYNVREEARDAVRAGTRWEAFRDQIWRRQPKDRGIDAPPTHLGMGRRGAGGRVLSQREQDRYREDFVATLRGVANTRAIERNLVTEYSEQLARETGMGFRGPLGFLIDPDLLFAGVMGKRDLSVGTPTAGGHLVATNLLAGSFIELLRARSAVMQMAPTVLPGLVGNVDIPRQTAAATTYWINEGSNTTESNPAFDKVSLAPRTVSARVDMTRKLLLQSTPAIVGILQADMSKQIATAIDQAAINGSGTAPVPRGVLNTAGIGSVTYVPTTPLTKFQSVIALLTALAAANADDATSGFITTPEIRAAFMSVFPDPGAGASIWNPARDSEGRSSLLGFPAVVTNNVPKNLGAGTNEHALIFGNWRELVIGLWGILEINMDPYALADSGGLVMRAFQDLDIAVKHAQSFAFTKFIP